MLRDNRFSLDNDSIRVLVDPDLTQIRQHGFDCIGWERKRDNTTEFAATDLVCHDVVDVRLVERLGHFLLTPGRDSDLNESHDLALHAVD